MTASVGARARRKVFPNLYRDSVALMQVSAGLAGRPGVEQAAAVMATQSNLELLHEAGLLDEAGDFGPNDLLVAVAGEASALDDALEEAERLLTRAATSADSTASKRTPPRSIEMGLRELPCANLALISTPGEYAAAEARKALNLGLNVMLFSDNVALADEVALKQQAAETGRLVMGPDCGTAIIDGVPLGFANVIRRGEIGVVAASGTGLQQVTCLVDRRGKGISQAIGTGGRDLKSEVGGATMLRGLAALAGDTRTKVIVLISKPPAKQVAAKVLAAAANVPKPVVVNFLGADLTARPDAGVYPATTLEDAAELAIALADGKPPAAARDSPDPSADSVTAVLAPGQRFVRGLFSGGTFCYEALLLLSAALGKVYSNTPVDPDRALSDPWVSREHTLVDLGDDVFTRGRPHPMIDGTLRNERIVAEAGDREVAVILLDLVLGYGAHDDPAAGMAESIRTARARAAGEGRQIVFVASVCGTAGDPQNLERQASILRDEGVLLTSSNAAAARLAARIAARAGALEDSR